MAKYLILIYSQESEWAGISEQERASVHARFGAFQEANEAVILGGAELEPTATATAIRLNGAGGQVVTDGAFVETKEALGGYYLIEVESLDEAIAVAKQIPMPFGGFEVRPIVQYAE